MPVSMWPPRSFQEPQQEDSWSVELSVATEDGVDVSHDLEVLSGACMPKSEIPSGHTRSGRQLGAPRRRRHTHTYTHSRLYLKGSRSPPKDTNFKQDYPDRGSAFTPNLDPPSRSVTLPTMGLRNFLAPSWNFSRNLIFPSKS